MPLYSKYAILGLALISSLAVHAASGQASLADSSSSAARVTMRMGFIDGSATLFKAGKNRLDRLADEFRDRGVTRILAIGHTSDKPVPARSRSKFPDNYNLSYARASVVANYLSGAFHLPPGRVNVVGRGPDDPLDSNDTERGRELNERIVLLFETGFERIKPLAVVFAPLQDPIVELPDPGAPSLSLAKPRVDVDRRDTVSVESDVSIEGGTRESSFAGGTADVDATAFAPIELPAYEAGATQTLTTELFDDQPVVDGMTVLPEAGSPNLYRDLGRLPGFTDAISGRIGSGYSTNIFEQSVDSVGSMMLQSSLTTQLLFEPSPENRIALWASGFASPYRLESAPATFLGRGGLSVSHRINQRVLAAVSADGRIESDDVVNKEGEDPRREFAHVAGRFQPSVQFAAGRRGSLALTWSTERVDFDEQPGLISLDYWQHGPSVRFRTRVGPIADLTAEYAFRMQRYDDELASLRTGQERPTNPVEKHNFDRLSVDARLQPVEVISVIVGYGFERKDDRYVGFESWTDHGLRAGFESSIAPRITLGVGLRYDNRRYDNRLGDDGARLRYDLVVVEGSAALEMTEHLSLYATARSANRNTNRSFGSEFLDIKVSQVASGIAFTY